MESHGEAGRIQVSDRTKQLLGDGFRCQRRGVVDVKGKGPIETWWVLGTK